jgi:hypothetical protein
MKRYVLTQGTLGRVLEKEFEAITGCYTYFIDVAIDYLRRKYNVHIYNTAPPFVAPATKKVVYAFSVKVCNTQLGWNGRKTLGSTKWYENVYQAKREALKIALNWILSQKSQKSKKPKRAINASSKTK